MSEFLSLRKSTGILLVLFLSVALTRCDANSTSDQQGDPAASDRRVVPRSWSSPQKIDVGLSPFRPGSNVQDLTSVHRGALLALGVFGVQDQTDTDPHRLAILGYSNGSWDLLLQIEADVPFNTAAVAVDEFERPIVFWVGDPTGASNESSQRTGLFAQPATTLYACQIVALACARRDSLDFGRQIRARIQDHISFDGAISLSLLEMPLLNHHITYRGNILRQADYIFGRFGKFVKSGGELVLIGTDPNESTGSGLRVFNSKWIGDAWNAPATVFESPTESAVDVSEPVLDFNESVHFAFLATGQGRERVYHVQSGDGGMSWGEPTLMREQSPFVMDPLSILRDEAGVIHVIMGSATGFNQFEWYQRTYFHGKWSEQEPFPPTVGMSPRSIHTVIMGDGRLLAVWREQDDMYFSIYE